MEARSELEAGGAPESEKICRLVVFSLDQTYYALDLSCVERVVQATQVIPLPRAPEIAMGVFNLHGRILPVVNIRKRFELPRKEIDTGDFFIIAGTSKRSLVLVADAVLGVEERTIGSVVPAERILPRLPYLAGVVKLKDDLVFIHNLEKFLSLDEERLLDEALDTGTSEMP